MYRLIRMFIYLVYIATMFFMFHSVLTNWSRQAIFLIVLVLGVMYLRGAMNYEMKLIKEGKDTETLIANWFRKRRS